MSRIRFSIRTLLVLALLVAVGIVVYRRQVKIRGFVERVESFGGTVAYKSDSWAPFHRATNDFFASPVEVDLSNGRVNRGDLEGIDALQSLERLYLARTNVGVEDVEFAVKCRKLKRLSLWGNSSIHSGVIAEVLKCPTLEALDISDTRVVPGRLGPLGEHPNLNFLAFSPHFRSQEDECLTGDVMDNLSRIKHLRPTDQCFLWRFNAEQLIQFCRTDTSRVTELLLRDSTLSDPACSLINTVPASELDIQRCEFDDRRLQLLDATKFNRIDIFNEKDRDPPNVSLAGLSEWIPGDLQSVTVESDRVEFTCGNRHYWTYRLSLPTPPLDEVVVQRWLELGASSIRLGADDHLANDLRVVAKLNPSIELSISNHPFIWTIIADMTRLNGLVIYNYDNQAFRFKAGMQLESLQIYGKTRPGKQLFYEIAKLEKLQWLWIRNQSTVTQDDVRPLEKLKRLEYVDIQRATGEAKTFLETLLISDAS